MWGSSIWKRLALVVAGVAIGLVLTEAGLQVAAWGVQRAVGESLPRAWLTGDLRVLCLGDSHTYGLYFPAEKAYPIRLEALWAARGETPSLEVLNLGLPGTNSSSLVRILPDLLDTFSPELVLVMVGTNDYWTAPLKIGEVQASLASFAKHHSKLYKLFRLIRHGSKSARVELILDPAPSFEQGATNRIRAGDREFAVKWSRIGEAEGRGAPELYANLERLLAQAREGGARLILLTYPSRVGFPASASRVIREVAATVGAPLVDVAEAFEAQCRDVSCHELLIENDQHPREAGHELIAETLLDALPRLLALPLH